MVTYYSPMTFFATSFRLQAPSAIPCDAISSGRRDRACSPVADMGDIRRTAHGNEAHKPRKPHNQAPANRQKGTRSNQTKAPPSRNQILGFSFHTASLPSIREVLIQSASPGWIRRKICLCALSVSVVNQIKHFILPLPKPFLQDCGEYHQP
jgi:hypothetical protein